MILNFIFILTAGLTVEPFMCSPLYRGLSVTHLKETPDHRPLSAAFTTMEERLLWQ